MVRMSTEIQAAGVKSEQRDYWNHLSANWDRWQHVFDAATAPMTAAMLDAGAVRPGSTVLDLASGTGEPALSAARRVGPAGRVIGVDLAAGMVVIARRRGAGVAQLSYREGDAETIELPGLRFDAVLSRWGLMFLPDRRRALARVRELLVPGGRFTGATWCEPARVPIISIPFVVIGELLELPPPPPGRPGAFSLTDPEQVVGELTAAGLVEARADELTLTFRFDSVAEFVAFSRDLLPAHLHALVEERVPPADRPALWRAVGDRVAEFTEASGRVAVPNAALCFQAGEPEQPSEQTLE